MIAKNLIGCLIFLILSPFGKLAYARMSAADYGYMDGSGSSALGSELFGMLFLLLIGFLVYWFIRERDLRKYIFVIFVVIGLVTAIWKDLSGFEVLALIGGVIWLGIFILKRMLKSDFKKYGEPPKPDLSTRLKAPIRKISETRTNDRSPENPTKPKATKFFHRKLPKDASETVRGRFRKAMDGDPVAQLLLGQNYEMGDGVEDHYIEAAGWYKESAEQGNPDAKLKFASLLKSGLGVHKDLVLAKHYAQSAANSGHHFSKAEHRLLNELLDVTVENCSDVINPSNSLSSVSELTNTETNPDKHFLSTGMKAPDQEVLFWRGVGLEIGGDYGEAAKLYLKAAEKGHKKAQLNLSLLYRKGLGVEKSELKANKWLDLSNQ